MKVGYLKASALAIFVAAVIARFFYVVAKAVRITVLKIDPPMAGFDSEPIAHDSVQQDLGKEPETEKAVAGAVEHLLCDIVTISE
jgi:hypothetical protein